MKKKIAVIYGDGVGPEVTKQSVKVLEAVAEYYGHKFEYKFAQMGAVAIEKYGNPLPDKTLETCLKCDAVLLGAIGHPAYDNDPLATVRPEQGLLKLRQALGLYANIRPVIPFPSLHHISPLKSKYLENVDFLIFRELTGGIYFGKKETNPEQGYATDECTYKRSEIEQIAKLAFQYAAKRKNKVTLVDKSNVLETSRLWRSVVQGMTPLYPGVTVDYLFADNAAMQLMTNPRQFDVLLTDNMFGDILSDEASVLCGSLGLLPSASLGASHALFEPVHGDYYEASGKDIANPVGSILSVAMMLDYFNMYEEAAAVRDGVDWTITNGFLTRDIDVVNFYFTSTIGDLVSEYVAGSIPGSINKNNIELRKSTII